MARAAVADDRDGPAPVPGRVWAQSDGTHIDVRGLDPPAPLVAILRLIDAPGAGPVVIVHHDRDPQLLYPELAERGWEAERIAAPDDEIRLKLTRP
jgi:hypothetical protein